MIRAFALGLLLVWGVWLGACRTEPENGVVVTFPGSAVGREAEVLRAQLARFQEAHPDIRVVQRQTPDAADQRHQLYVQWLNARAPDPDILQLDVVWTAEFAAAGWILPLDAFAPEVTDMLPAALGAARWQGRLYAMPWFVDVGMLYWRTDLLSAPPASLADLESAATTLLRREDLRAAGLRYGLVWQGARYEGLVTVFVEYLGAFGGAILGAEGQVSVDSPPAVAALGAMRRQIRNGIVPEVALTWHEEETRLAFQNGQALFLRNWPYAFSLLENEAGSRVGGNFAVAAMPAASGGSPSAALGGSHLAVNARSDQPRAAWAVIEFLTGPDEMLERARAAGQYPARRSLYDGPALSRALGTDAEALRRIVERAVPRPVTPVYTQLSEILQIRLHRALIGEQEPAAALAEAAEEMRRLLATVGLLGEGRGRADG